MPIDPRPPIKAEPSDAVPKAETPALRFFSRGQQLQRLQQHVTTNMTAEIEREHAEFIRLSVTDSATAVKAAGMAMAVVASGTERMSDVQLILQLFFCRHIDNFQSFLEETLRAIYHKQPGKHPDSGLSLDEPYPVLPERIADEVKTLVTAAGDIEKRATPKFKLYSADL